MTTSIRQTPETIMVRPIDMAKLNKDANDAVRNAIHHPDTVTYHAAGPLAIGEVRGKAFIIDEEFIGGDIKDKVTFNLWKEERTPKGIIFNMMPEQSVTLPLAEVEAYLLPAVTLAEFTKARRGYNSRIIGNEAQWVRHFNS